MARPDRYWLRGLVLTLGLYVLVSLAIAEPFGLFFFIMLAAFALSVTLFYRLPFTRRELRRHGQH